MPRPFRGRGGQTLAACLGYIALTVAMTWPIARGIEHDVPADLGDALLVMGVLAWVSEGLVGISQGQMAFADLWNANFFHPTPLALTFSEHFIPQAVQGLPLYLATGNIVLAYNAVLLATFVLSGLGTFLLVRELTGSARAAFVAGLFYAFFPYRLGNFAHLHTLSSQWMPFVLFGFRRYFDTGARAALAGATLAFVVQGLSTGYYLFFFAPVLVGYVLWEMAGRGELMRWRRWAEIALAGVASALLTLPFLLPYARAQAMFGHSRPIDELTTYSADLLTYAHAPPQLYFWGPILHRFGQPEGGIFTGLVPVAAATAAVVIWLLKLGTARRVHEPRTARDRLSAAAMFGVAVLLGLSALIAVTGGVSWDVAGVPLRATSARRPLEYAAVLLVVAAWLSTPLRDTMRRHAADLTPWLVTALAFSVLMSLGPRPLVGGRPLVDVDVYEFFYTYVPGYSGLRVPARFGMIAGCLLAVLGGYALASLARWRRAGSLALTVVGGLFLAESYAVPMAVNLNWDTGPRYATPWGGGAPPQRRAARLPAPAGHAGRQRGPGAALRGPGVGPALRLLCGAARQAHRERLQRLFSGRLSRPRGASLDPVGGPAGGLDRRRDFRRHPRAGPRAGLPRPGRCGRVGVARHHGRPAHGGVRRRRRAVRAAAALSRPGGAPHDPRHARLSPIRRSRGFEWRLPMARIRIPSSTLGVFLAGLAAAVALVAGLSGQTPAVAIDGDDIGGIVSGPKGPEAGVWVIAETRDLGVRYIKSVVTDDHGRYVIPDLPAARYEVWVRGYGLVDSAKASSRPGQHVNITAVPAPTPAAAAAVLPGDLLVLDADDSRRQ